MVSNEEERSGKRKTATQKNKDENNGFHLNLN